MSLVNPVSSRGGFFAVLASSALVLSACGGSLQSTESLPQKQETPASAAASASATASAAASSLPSPTASSTPASPSPSATPSILPSTASPSPSSPAPTTTNPAAVVLPAPQNCGPSNTGASELILAAGAVSCEEVQSVFADFNFTYNESLEPIEVRGYICQTRDDTNRIAYGRSVTCTKGSTRLEAMQVYSLGGIPLAAQDYYYVNEGIYFRANGLACRVSDGNAVCINGLSVENPGVVGGYTRTDGPREDLGIPVSTYNPYFEARELPAGYSVSSHGQTCLNDGTFLTCTNGRGKTFKANAQDFITL